MLATALSRIKGFPRLVAQSSMMRDRRTRRRVRRALVWSLPVLLIIGLSGIAYYLTDVRGTGDPSVAGGAAFGVLSIALTFWRLRRILPWLIPVTLVSGLSYFLAQQIISAQTVHVITMVGGLLALVVIAARVDLGVAMLMILMATIMYPTAIPPPFKFAGAGLGTGELLMVYVLFVAYIKYLGKRRSHSVSSPLTPPVMLLLLSFLIGVAVGYRNYLADPKGFFEFKTVYSGLRPLIYYFAFFAVLFGIRTKQQYRFLFNVTLALGCIVAALVVAQYMVGRGTRLFIGAPDYMAVAIKGEAQDVSRLQPPGVPLNLMMLLATLYLAAAYGGKVGARYAVLAVILASGVVLGFARSTWIAVGVGLALYLVLSPLKAKGRLAALGAAIVAGGLLFTIGLASVAPGRGANLREALTNRFVSIFGSREGRGDDPLAGRKIENRQGLRTALQHPVFGVGLGTPLQYSYVNVSQRGDKRVVTEDWLHNSYLNLWLHHGVLGLFAYAWITVAFLLRAFRLWRRGDELWIRGVGVSLGVSHVLLLMRSSIAMTLTHQQWEIIVAAYAWGMVEAGNSLFVPGATPEPGAELAVQTQDPPDRTRVGVGELGTA